GRAHARGHARGDHPHDPRSPDVVRSRAGGNARRARPGDPHLSPAVGRSRPPTRPLHRAVEAKSRRVGTGAVGSRWAWPSSRSWCSPRPCITSSWTGTTSRTSPAIKSFRGLGRTQLEWMWTTTLLGHWVPLAWMTLGLDYLVWGMNPLGHHLTNVLLHTANAVVFYFVALRLLGAAGAPSAPAHPLASLR